MEQLVIVFCSLTFLKLTELLVCVSAILSCQITSLGEDRNDPILELTIENDNTVDECR